MLKVIKISALGGSGATGSVTSVSLVFAGTVDVLYNLKAAPSRPFTGEGSFFVSY
jgi:hypothetical protein